MSRARGEPDEVQRAALDELLALYWYPLYAFSRRRGANASDAQDLVQGFFAKLIENDYVGDAVKELGRFRTFLIASFRNYCSKERDKANALKRGGGHSVLSLDFADAEHRYSFEPTHNVTPEVLFERRWAHSVLDQTAQRLRLQAGARSPKHVTRLEALLPTVAGGTHRPYREIADELGLSETAVKVAVHRLRTRYGETLRAVIADTVADPKDVASEIRGLIDALRGEQTK